MFLKDNKVFVTCCDMATIWCEAKTATIFEIVSQSSNSLLLHRVSKPNIFFSDDDDGDRKTACVLNT